MNVDTNSHMKLADGVTAKLRDGEELIADDIT